MAKDNTITFYDLALSTGATISPFVWATKYALKHKGFDLDVVPGGFTGILERTGGKKETKIYRHHTGFIGSLKEIPGAKMLKEKPEAAIERAVRGMLPEGVLGHRMLGKLKVYKGSEHPHAAQGPEAYKVSFQRNK